MKKFNYTGTCIPAKHYMVDTSKKIDEISRFIEDGEYFTINRPRQYGKTTSLTLLENKLKNDYVLISISFAGKNSEFFESVTNFSKLFVNLLNNSLKDNNKNNLLIEYKPESNLETISEDITTLITKSEKKIILFIDEVDEATNYELFSKFLGMLRNKFLDAAKGADTTFHSVVLAGVHDIKNLKMKIRGDGEISYNSPWNIAINFKVNMSFSPEEISTMLVDYERDNQTNMDKNLISKRLYEYTSGYPFLVSRLCCIIDNELNKDFTENGLEQAMKIILDEDNTLFDDLIKNIERYNELHDLVEELLIENRTIDYAQTDRVISLGATYGIFDRSKENKVKIHNKIFEILILNHLTASIARKECRISRYNFRDNFLDDNGDLEFDRILLKFQQFMKENYSDKDDRFYEKQGRLLLIAFIKPIINGIGFYYVENQLSFEKRTDMVITHNKKEYIVELKVWYGEESHKKGLKQLTEYLEIKSQKQGYLVIFSFNKNKEYTAKKYNLDGKEIFEVVV